MTENSINLFKRKDREKEMELVKSVIETSRALNLANRNFETAEEELIDYYSYQIKANKAKLDYLIRKVKQKGLALDIINALEIETYLNKAM